jgi:hypothetical protein
MGWIERKWEIGGNLVKKVGKEDGGVGLCGVKKKTAEAIGVEELWQMGIVEEGVGFDMCWL